jgi:hypothetical protein
MATTSRSSSSNKLVRQNLFRSLIFFRLFATSVMLSSVSKASNKCFRNELHSSLLPPTHERLDGVAVTVERNDGGTATTGDERPSLLLLVSRCGVGSKVSLPHSQNFRWPLNDEARPAVS